MENIFQEGKKQDINAVLLAKDKRVQIQQELFRNFPREVLVDVKLNVPGPIKNNHFLENLFEKGIILLEQIFQEKRLHYRLVKKINVATGEENFYLVSAEALKVKKATITFEEKSKLGRIFDADVLIAEQNMAISREQLHYPIRKCFLCSNPAKICARSRRHSVEQLQDYFNQLYAKEF